MFIESITEQQKPHSIIHSRVRGSMHGKHVKPSSPLASDEWSVNPRFHFLGRLLHLKLELARILDVVKVIEFDTLKKHGEDICRLAHPITILLPELLSECQQIVAEARIAIQPKHQVEAKLLHAQLVALELALPPRSKKEGKKNIRYCTQRRTQEIASLREAVALCKQYPATTLGLQALVEKALQIFQVEPALDQPVITVDQMMPFGTIGIQGWTETDYWNSCVNRHMVSLQAIC